jgi:hypothetical protein
MKAVGLQTQVELLLAEDVVLLYSLRRYGMHMEGADSALPGQMADPNCEQ